MGKHAELLPGTLDMLILKALSLGPLHGYGVIQRIRQMSEEMLSVEHTHVLQEVRAGHAIEQQNTTGRADTEQVRQGMLEGSNVRPILEITRMIEVNRAYESMAKMMDSNADLSRRTVERMGRVQ